MAPVDNTFDAEDAGGFQAFNGTQKLIADDTAVAVLQWIQFLYPVFLLFLFLGSLAAYGIITSNTDAATTKGVTDNKKIVLGPGGKPLPVRSLKKKDSQSNTTGSSLVKRLLFIWLSVGLIATFAGNAANILVHALVKRTGGGWWCGVEAVIYVAGSVFLYGFFLVSLLDSNPAPSVVHLTTWVAALILEVLLMGFSASIYTSPHHELNSLRRKGKALDGPSQWELVELCCDAARILLLVLSIAFFMIFWLQTNSRVVPVVNGRVDEHAPLLGAALDENGLDIAENGHARHGGHGTFNNNGAATKAHANGKTADDNDSANGSADKDSDAKGNAIITIGGRKAPDETAAFYRPTSAPARSWWEYIRGYSLFFPYLWPSKSLRLKVLLLICFVLVILQRVINFLVPWQVGNVVDLLAPDDGSEPKMPYLQIALFIVFKLLQGPSGILGAIRATLWIPVAQYSYQALSTASFEHVHGLSLDFHLAKRTGEVISALSKGGAINTFLEQVTFQVLPMLFDVITAIIYLQASYDAYYTLTLTIVTCLYLYLTVRLAQWRAEQRRTMINLDREEDAVKNDSLQSYETVKYFGAEDYEFGRYRGAVHKKQKAEAAVMLSLNVMNISQNMVFMAGLLVVSFIAAYQVTTGQRKVGKFVTLLTYFQQLQGPLNFFGTFYRSVQSAMISGERLLELFKEQPTVVDKPGARDLVKCKGQIRFDKVRFAYDERKPALKDFSFTCPEGTTTALVGESGGGKSTIFRLLFRFYNVQAGRILIDDRDAEHVTVKSLRSHIGVVPQDTILFNETLMYNLKYANQNATDEEVFDACRAASIHDKILAFPDGYNTKVGERGLRLSGGEKQRVAIARTILKNPRIIMLDEATAALDSETEQNIQEALKTLSQGRTMLVIAHRLSTITNADQIVVLHKGAVAESGTHDELLAQRGRYATMWRKQIRAEKAAEEVRVLTDRVEAIRNESITRPSSRDGMTSEYTSETENEAGSSSTPARGVSGLAGRASNGLRGAVALFRSETDDGSSGKPHGHP